MEELCPGHQRRRHRCSKSTFACPGSRYNLLISPGLHEEKERGAHYYKVLAVTLQLPHPPTPPSCNRITDFDLCFSSPLGMIKHKKGKSAREAARLPESETDERTIQGEGERFILAARRGGRCQRVSSDARVISFGRPASAPRQQG